MLIMKRQSGAFRQPVIRSYLVRKMKMERILGIVIPSVVCVGVCECSKGVRSSSNPNETSSMDLYWESTSGCITMASDVAFMHKYIYANRIAIPKRHDAGRDNIFIWIQMALFLSSSMLQRQTGLFFSPTCTYQQSRECFFA